MSRKARLTVYRDRLEAISECPGTVFNELNPTDVILELIEKAEAGDRDSIDILVMELYKRARENESHSDAMIYFLKKGLALASPLCGLIAVSYIDFFNSDFDLLDAALESISGSDNTEAYLDAAERARIKRIIAAPSRECDFDALRAELTERKPRTLGAVMLYLAAKERCYKGAPVTDEVHGIAADEGLGEIMLLPTFGGRCECERLRTPDDSERQCRLLNAIYRLYDSREWQDFWLTIMYEYAVIYLCKDLSAFIESMLAIVSARRAYREKPMHELALKRYAEEHGLGYTREECDELEKICRFNGLQIPETVEELVREAVYAVAPPPCCGEYSTVCDAEIQHERNRYTITMTLNEHKKRASRHQWDALIAIRTDEDEPPTIEPVPIVEMRAQISRNGVTLEKEKKAAQVLCAGEIRIGDKTSPLELDLILDISYVSLTKCTHCSVKIERYKRQGAYLIMHADIGIYNKSK